jgi:uncharacterized membrane protein
MAQSPSARNRPVGWRFPMFLLVLVATGPFAIHAYRWERGSLIAFDVAAALFLAACLNVLLSKSDDMRAAAMVNDGNRLIRLVTAISLAVVVFAAMTALIVDRAVLTGSDKILVTISLGLAWTFANTVYAMHYAHLYYAVDSEGHDCGGIKFPETDEPAMWDFVYFAFTIGVALQTADVSIGSGRIRRIVTGHEVVSFFFNVGVLALVVNVVGSS